MHCVRKANGTGWAPPASAAVRESPWSSNQFNRTALRAELEEKMKRLVRSSAITAAALMVAACATSTGGGGGPSGGGVSPDQTTATQPGIVWGIKTREHVDLWLHGFALLQEDTTFVPFFRRGYGTDMTVLKNRANVVTQLDANRDRLRARLATNPQLINAQFVPLSFPSWAELNSAVDLFVRANGDPRAASSQQ